MRHESLNTNHLGANKSLLFCVTSTPHSWGNISADHICFYHPFSVLIVSLLSSSTIPWEFFTHMRNNDALCPVVNLLDLENKNGCRFILHIGILISRNSLRSSHKKRLNFSEWVLSELVQPVSHKMSKFGTVTIKIRNRGKTAWADIQEEKIAEKECKEIDCDGVLSTLRLPLARCNIIRLLESNITLARCTKSRKKS